jgi:apolipoprotein N-acyltransferase
MIPRLLLAGLAGAALSLAFEPVAAWWLAPLAVAVLTAVCRDRTLPAGGLLGLVFGLAFTIPLLSWLGAVIGRDAGLGLSVYTALWLGAVGAGTTAVQRRPGALAVLAVPAVWVLVEGVAGRIPFGGWGWWRLGFSGADSVLLPVASLAGVPGLTFATALVGSLLAAAAAPGTARRWVPGALAVATVALAAAVAVPTGAQSAAGPASVDVGLVQGDVPRAGLDFNAQRRAVLDNHVQGTFALAQDVADGVVPQPDLVLWPENASDIDPFRNADARAEIEAAAAAIAAPILVGAVVDDSDDPTLVRNQGIVWDPATGPGERYTKRNLVPFGEYVPFRPLLARWITRFDRVPRDFAPGTEPGGLDIGPTRVGVAICFDVAYDDALRDAARDGARMLVVQTNNATYNGTAQPAQQLAISRIRAVEHGRAVAVVSTSGLSAVIAPDASVVPGTAFGELEAGRTVVPVGQRDTLTVADRLGALPELAAALFGAIAIALGVARPTAGPRSSRRPAGIVQEHQPLTLEDV